VSLANVVSVVRGPSSVVRVSLRREDCTGRARVGDVEKRKATGPATAATVRRENDQQIATVHGHEAVATGNPNSSVQPSNGLEVFARPVGLAPEPWPLGLRVGDVRKEPDEQHDS
jgi:hypothetical protein